MPDYNLYDEWLEMQDVKNKRNEYKYYLDYSIGFLTRGCFRQCDFCVNKNYKKVSVHSPLSEFVREDRKKICLLDDNFFGCPSWKELLTELQETKKPFQFKQGLDERLLTDEKCELLFKSKYDGDYIFAFDNIADKPIITKGLNLIRKYTNKRCKFYVFCGFDRNDKWDTQFWKQDLFDLWERIKILMMYDCVPYVMRFNRYVESPYKGHYISVTNWCNQPGLFRTMSYRTFVEKRNALRKNGDGSDMRYMKQVLNDIPELEYYFDFCVKSIRICYEGQI